MATKYIDSDFQTFFVHVLPTAAMAKSNSTWEVGYICCISSNLIWQIQLVIFVVIFQELEQCSRSDPVQLLNLLNETFWPTVSIITF